MTDAAAKDVRGKGALIVMEQAASVGTFFSHRRKKEKKSFFRLNYRISVILLKSVSFLSAIRGSQVE